MCGIAGFVNLQGDPVSPVILKRMTDAIAHRGPDGEGQWIEGNVGVGHRRLAILDLSPAGHQPMVTADHRFVLSYNGEVYNYREIRAELEAEGIWFRSQTDSEVVLYALAQWGTDALLKFNGMFALVLWDRKEKKLLLARDRYGIKPLYYCSQNSVFMFSSEQKAFAAHPGFRRVLNKRALFEYFTFQNIFTDQTLLADVKVLPAGHYAMLSTENAVPHLSQYWDYRFREPEVQGDVAGYLEELDRLFVQAVNRQLVSDVELGAYLSGGMDSGSITAVASRSIANLKSFTVGFDLSSASGLELGFDERAKAEAMSALFRTEHYEMVLKAGDMERCLPGLAWHLEEPRVGQSYPNYYAAKLAGKFVKVVLAGSGGDELFGGYPWRYYRAARGRNFEEYIDEYYSYWQRLVDSDELARMFRPISADIRDVDTRDIFRGVFLTHDNDLSTPGDFINHSLYFEAKTFLHGLLAVEDKLSMAHSLENRVPFLDNDLVDFAMRCPLRVKLNSAPRNMRVDENDPRSKREANLQLANEGKQILRQMMANYVPDDIARGRKQGFSSPDASWFKGESINFVCKALINKHSPIYELLDFDQVKALIESHLEGKVNRRLLIWSLLNIHFYLKEYS